MVEKAPKTSSVTIPLGALARQVDSNFDKARLNELEYEFTNPKGKGQRQFRANRSRRWPYNQTPPA